MVGGKFVALELDFGLSLEVGIAGQRSSRCNGNLYFVVVGFGSAGKLLARMGRKIVGFGPYNHNCNFEATAVHLLANFGRLESFDSKAFESAISHSISWWNIGNLGFEHSSYCRILQFLICKKFS